MPWRETSPVNERVQFIAEYERQAQVGRVNMAQLCRAYGISRKTGYKWLRRYEVEGPGGLDDRPPIPGRCPHATSDELRKLVVSARRAHPTWGPRKLRAWLQREWPEVTLPAPSTMGEILKREGLVKPRVRRRRATPRGPSTVKAEAPNDVWGADYKGHFKTGDGHRCDPLTITDAFSRFIIAVEAHPRIATTLAMATFERAFRTYGLPWAIRTDNGTPFAAASLQGLTQLSVWFLKLGIGLQRIEPGRPEQNGRHERMHLTLKRETTRPPRNSLQAQQGAFERFRSEYNEVRPHEALGQTPPASVYQPSTREYPVDVPAPTYPAHFLVRIVKSHGDIRFGGRRYFLSQTLRSEPVGLIEVADGVWAVHFASLELGQLDERNQVFNPLRGPRVRRRNN